VDSVYTEFSKAFDRVRLQLLLEEMSVGIEPKRCLWLRSYLTARIQRIRIGDAVSKDIRGTSGIPQSSHHETLCFIWFVNRISVIFVSSTRGFKVCIKIQSDLNKLSEWCERNSLFLNVDKCKTITFSRTRYPVNPCLYAGWNCTGSGKLYKQSGGHHRRACRRHGFCDAGIYQKTVIRVPKSIHSEVSLHVFSSFEAGVRQLCMESILSRVCRQG
jgi:hypothetical protein